MSDLSNQQECRDLERPIALEARLARPPGRIAGADQS
jgi:hypothetical protein